MKRIIFIFLLIFASTFASAQTTTMLPVIPKNEVIALWDSCTYIDYIYMTPSFSMSMEDKNSIQQTVHLITGRSFLPKDKAKPTAKVFFQIKGKIVQQADFFYYPEESLGGFIFYKDNKKTYSSLMHIDGKAYFDGIFAEINK
jgi:surface polysaccharide O-acyltransferase-like enzyme